MVYEAVLLFGVAFAVGLVLISSLQWTYPLPPNRRLVLQVVLFITLGAYFVVCWTGTGQTLALKAWRMKVTDSGGRSPGSTRAVARYLLAWHLWLPGLAATAWLNLGIGSSIASIVIGFVLLLIPPLIDPQRRWLHDRWSGTRVVRVPDETSRRGALPI